MARYTYSQGHQFTINVNASIYSSSDDEEVIKRQEEAKLAAELARQMSDNSDSERERRRKRRKRKSRKSDHIKRCGPRLCNLIILWCDSNPLADNSLG